MFNHKLIESAVIGLAALAGSLGTCVPAALADETTDAHVSASSPIRYDFGSVGNGIVERVSGCSIAPGGILTKTDNAHNGVTSWNATVYEGHYISYYNDWDSSERYKINAVKDLVYSLDVNHIYHASTYENRLCVDPIYFGKPVERLYGIKVHSLRPGDVIRIDGHNAVVVTKIKQSWGTQTYEEDLGAFPMFDGDVVLETCVGDGRVDGISGHNCIVFCHVIS